MRRSLSLASFILLCSGALVMSCSRINQLASRYAKQQGISASEGGVITVAEGEHAMLAGTRLEIPAQALEQDQVITVELGAAHIADHNAGLPVTFGPAGLKFKKPVTLTLPLSKEGPVFIQVEEVDGTRFTIPESQVTVNGKFATFQISGFTTFQPSSRTPCASNADCAAGELCDAASGTCVDSCLTMLCGQGTTCLNGACVANLRCTTNADCIPGYACNAGSCQKIGACSSATDAGVATDGGSSSTQCAQGEICLNGQCTDACAAIRCAPGYTCSAGNCAKNTTCSNAVDAGVAMDGGSSSAQCAQGEICLNGLCTDACAAIRCAPGYTCNLGQCVAVPDGGSHGPGSDGGTHSCRQDPDCPNIQEVCDLNTLTCTNPCLTMLCAQGTTCERGQCVTPTDGGVSDGGSAAVDAGVAGCLTNADCPASLPVCDPVSMTCQDACYSVLCNQGFTCSAGSCVENVQCDGIRVLCAANKSCLNGLCQ